MVGSSKSCLWSGLLSTLTFGFLPNFSCIFLFAASCRLDLRARARALSGLPCRYVWYPDWWKPCRIVSYCIVVAIYATTVSRLTEEAERLEASISNQVECGVMKVDRMMWMKYQPTAHIQHLYIPKLRVVPSSYWGVVWHERCGRW